MRYHVVPPQVDMLLVSKNSRAQRRVLRDFVPNIGLNFVDYGRLGEIDDFYFDCQSFRDYYRDPYNRISVPASFLNQCIKCGARTRDVNSELLSRPTIWVKEPRPVVFAVDYTAKPYLETGYSLGGKYDPICCTKFKR
ncbi:uncharacterized protein LOC119687605 [Teleopsis dalmanni]|uniref:uncharacterized protein LOC119687605 n=1 Tax=Teleopsis dalmanni TaxID=139649 RepID=UPI0018CD6AD5|nr:uncharacterized protein LOC119687605 [Teleopsis dalmanni]